MGNMLRRNDQQTLATDWRQGGVGKGKGSSKVGNLGDWEDSGTLIRNQDWAELGMEVDGKDNDFCFGQGEFEDIKSDFLTFENPFV